MNLDVCPDCEREISLRANPCPHCGCPSPFGKNGNDISGNGHAPVHLPAVAGADNPEEITKKKKATVRISLPPKPLGNKQTIRIALPPGGVEAAAPGALAPMMMSGQYFIAREGEQTGPYTLEQIQQMRAAGELLPSDLAWTEGQADWLPLSQISQKPIKFWWWLIGLGLLTALIVQWML